MSCLRIPQTICILIDQNFIKFYWGGSQQIKKIHWLKWNTLCQRKYEGGLGIRQTGLFNQCFLAKQAWYLITQPTSLLAQLFKAVYFPQSTFLEATLGSEPSPYWRVLCGRDLLNLGLGWKVRNENQIKIITDNWLPGTTHFSTSHYIKLMIFHPILLESQISSVLTHTWDTQLLKSYHTPIDVERVPQIPIPPLLKLTE